MSLHDWMWIVGYIVVADAIIVGAWLILQKLDGD